MDNVESQSYVHWSANNPNEACHGTFRKVPAAPHQSIITIDMSADKESRTDISELIDHIGKQAHEIAELSAQIERITKALKDHESLLLKLQRESSIKAHTDPRDNEEQPVDGSGPKVDNEEQMEAASRNAFEVWALLNKLSIIRGDIGYCFMTTQLLWEGWNARKAWDDKTANRTNGGN